MRKEKQDIVTGDILTCDSEGDPVDWEVTCEAGADSSPNEGNNGLIWTSEGDPIERDLTCEDGETTSANEGNNGLICTSEGDPIET